MKVAVETYIKGQQSQFFGLVRLEKSDDGKRVEHCPLYYTPNWKTARGAERYAKKNGYELVTP